MDKEQTIHKLRQFIDTKHNGIPPTFEELRKIEPSLCWFIGKHGGYLLLKKLCGFNVIIRKSPHYWNWDTLEKNIRNIIKDNVFPTIKQIEEKLGTGACKQIYKQGGMKSVAAKMGFSIATCLVTSDGHHVQSSYEYLLDEFLYHHKIPHEVGGKIHPDYNFRYDFKVGEYFIEIWGYSRNNNNKRCVRYLLNRDIKEKLYKKLVYKLISLEIDDFKESAFEKRLEHILQQFSTYSQNTFPIHNYINHTKYWNFENTLREVKRLSSNLGRFPNGKELKTKKGLLYAVYKHGGTKLLSKAIGIPICRNHWDEKSIQKSLTEISANLGHFPIADELKKEYSGLLDAICDRYGGLNKFREKLGYSVEKKWGYWNEKNIKEALRNLIVKLGRKPTYKEMGKELVGAIYGRKLQYLLKS